MAYYAYKGVRDLLPQYIIDRQGPDYEGGGDYDGDQWDAAADYIVDLIASNAILRAKVSYYEEQLDKAAQFRKAADNQGPF